MGRWGELPAGSPALPFLWPEWTSSALAHRRRALPSLCRRVRSWASRDRDEGYTLARRRRRQFGAVLAIERALGTPEDEAKARFNAMDVEAASAYIEDHAELLGAGCEEAVVDPART